MRNSSTAATVANLLAFVAFGSFIVWLYVQNQQIWEGRVEENQTLLDSLQQQNQQLKNTLTYYKENEFLRQQAVHDNYFDPFDSENFRMYGLYRDVGKRLTDLDVAMKFNITNANSIKSNDVMSERWFIVPVKGVHYYMGNETLTEIANLYYENPADSVLIQQFNLSRKPGTNLIIPFGGN